MIDIHPEDLLDREREGILTAEERAYLEAHLERCAACRIERLLARECALERALIDEVAERQQEPEPCLERSPPRAPQSARRARRLVPRAGIVVGALLLAGGAAALGGGLPWQAPAQVPVTIPPDVTASSTPRIPVHRSRPNGIRQLPSASSAPAGEVPSASAAPAGEVPSAAVPPRVSPRPSKAHPTAASLFSDAAAARRDGDYERSLALYERLIERHPSSVEAATARAVRARLLLDLGRARAAERGFREAAATAGPLSEVALVGQAQALRRAGKLDAERAVWRDLLRRFPDSPQAAVARARLAELGAD
ncbi:MAG: tetratricopeptide repeat protein [Myxococcales bacterium]|nr:tetratricopeptide repeat protein [Myxococcales bacterium]